MRAWQYRIALSCISIGFGAMAFADDLPFSDAAPVADDTLDEVRGGFEMPTELHASMTLERSAYLNGERVFNRSVTIPDIGNITAEQAAALAETAGTIVIQNGPNNAFNVPDLGPASTVIQNTLNDQHLVTLTTLSVEVNSLAAFRELNFQDGLRDSLVIPGVR
jgi:3-phosphoglycerate kinase